MKPSRTRTPAIEAWFARQAIGLPGPMAGELERWLAIMLHGTRNPPRRQPRSRMTTRLHLTWALPALRAWAGAGITSLREVSASHIRAVLPPSGNPRSTMGAGLRSILTVLKQQKVIFTNPIAWIKTGYHEPRQPLPVNLALVREALESPDPARAALVALVAFHGLRAGQVRDLKLTDARDGRLHLRDHTVLLAGPARVRLAAWLDYRARHWPATANPHLFITMRSATGLGPAGDRWVKLKTGVPGGVQAIREDRILHEAHASGGDIRRICDLFGLSISAAERYAATLDHPDLIARANGQEDT
jgi:integrase